MHFGDAVLLVLLFLVVEIALQILVGVVIHVGKRGNLFWAAERLISFCAVYLIIRKRQGGSLGEYLGASSAPVSVYALIMAGVLGIHFLVEPVDAFLRVYVPFFDFYRDPYHSSDVEGTILLSIIVAPAIEEFLFRGVILRGFSRNHRIPSALVLSSLLFALHHHNPAQLIGPFCLGVLLGAALLRTDSILPCVFGHLLTNGLWFFARANRDAAELLSIGVTIGEPTLLVSRLVVGIGLAVVSISLLLLPLLERNKEVIEGRGP